jgi:hypothetical protein
VELYELAEGAERRLVADVATNADGRTDKPILSAAGRGPAGSSSSSTRGTISAASARSWPTPLSST